MGHYCHGKTPLKTAHFELLIPIDETLRSKTNHHKGKLPTYWCDDGRAILRRYECKIIFHEMGLVNKSTL